VLIARNLRGSVTAKAFWRAGKFSGNLELALEEAGRASEVAAEPCYVAEMGKY